jgi:hypothetical protein
LPPPTIPTQTIPTQTTRPTIAQPTLGGGTARPATLKSAPPGTGEGLTPSRGGRPYVPEPATRPLPPEVLGQGQANRPLPPEVAGTSPAGRPLSPETVGQSPAGAPALGDNPAAARGGTPNRGLRSLGRSRHAAPEAVSAPLPTPTPITPPLPNPQPLTPPHRAEPTPMAEVGGAPGRSGKLRPAPAPRVQHDTRDDVRAESPPATTPEPTQGGRRFGGRKRKDANEYVDWVSGLGND